MPLLMRALSAMVALLGPLVCVVVGSAAAQGCLGDFALLQLVLWVCSWCCERVRKQGRVRRCEVLRGRSGIVGSYMAMLDK